MTLAKVLENKELADLVTALGCGLGKNFDLSRLRYRQGDRAGRRRLGRPSHRDAAPHLHLSPPAAAHHRRQGVLAQPPLTASTSGRSRSGPSTTRTGTGCSSSTAMDAVTRRHALQGLGEMMPRDCGTPRSIRDTPAAARGHRGSHRHRPRDRRVDGQGRIGTIPLHHGTRRRRRGAQRLGAGAPSRGACNTGTSDHKERRVPLRASRQLRQKQEAFRSLDHRRT